MIECKINDNKYLTERLYFKDFTKLGFLLEEKIFPFLSCLLTCIGNKLSDGELLKALYTSCKDIFKMEDLEYISELVLNREHLRVNGKQLDNAEWEKHWQNAGFIEYQTLIIKLIGENLGNFTSLSTILPKGWTEIIVNELKAKFYQSFSNPEELLRK